MHLFNDVKTRMHNGTIPDCLTSQTILNQDQSGMTDLEVAYTVSSPFGAGIETVSVLNSMNDVWAEGYEDRWYIDNVYTWALNVPSS